MKKIFAVVLAAALCLTVCGCTNVFKEFKESADKAVESASASPSASPSPTDNPFADQPAAGGVSDEPEPSWYNAPEFKEKEKAPASAAPSDAGADAASAESAALPAQNPTPAVQSAAPAARAETAAAPASDAAAYAYEPVKVTKSPTSEVVYEGGSASFVAYAQNSTGITWLLVAPDGGQIFDAFALAKSMPGLSISGAGTTTLTIGCIPLSLDGWCVQAKFYGEGGPVHSSMARLSVWKYPASGTWNPWEQGGWNPWG